VKKVKLFQSKGVEGFLKYSFLFDEINSEDFKNDFELVAEHDYEDDLDDFEISEMIFDKYNRDDRPNGRTHRSMCVGDIVQINDNMYVCRTCGFERLDL